MWIGGFVASVLPSLRFNAYVLFVLQADSLSEEQIAGKCLCLMTGPSKPSCILSTCIYTAVMQSNEHLCCIGLFRIGYSIIPQ